MILFSRWTRAAQSQLLLAGMSVITKFKQQSQFLNTISLLKVSSFDLKFSIFLLIYIILLCYSTWNKYICCMKPLTIVYEVYSKIVRFAIHIKVGIDIREGKSYILVERKACHVGLTIPARLHVLVLSFFLQSFFQYCDFLKGWVNLPPHLLSSLFCFPFSSLTIHLLLL